MLEIALGGTTLFFFYKYMTETERRRDLETELKKVVARNDLDSRDLRRSLRVKSFRKWLTKRHEKQLKENLEDSKLKGDKE